MLPLGQSVNSLGVVLYQSLTEMAQELLHFPWVLCQSHSFFVPVSRLTVPQKMFTPSRLWLADG